MIGIFYKILPPGILPHEHLVEVFLFLASVIFKPAVLRANDRLAITLHFPTVPSFDHIR